jgi:hypothetical protein
MSSASCPERRSVSYSLRKSVACCIGECSGDDLNVVCRDMDFSLTGMGSYFYSDPWYNFRANEDQTVLNTMKHKILLRNRFSCYVTAIKRLPLHWREGNNRRVFMKLILNTLVHPGATLEFPEC